MQSRRPTLFVALSRLLLLAYISWTIFPLAIMFKTAFSRPSLASDFQESDLSLDSFRQVLTDPSNSFSVSLVNSLLLSTSVCVVCLLLGIPAAYALARLTGRTSMLLGGWIFSARFLPPVIPAIVLFIVFRNLGLMDTPLPLFFCDLLVGMPFAIWVSRSYISDLPLSLEDMAELDGIPLWHRLIKIIVPSLRRPLVAIMAMVWLLVWNEYFFALIFGGYSRPLTVLLASWNTYQGVLWGPACAAGVLAIIPAVTLLFLSIRFLLRGFLFGVRVDS